VKIALLTLDFPPGVGGVQQYLFEIARRLGVAYELTVVTPVGGPLPKVPFHRLILPSCHPWTFARVLLVLKPDHVLVGHTHPRLLLSAALCASKRYAAIAYGNDYLAAQNRWHRPLFNALLSGAHPLITISQANAWRLRALGIPNPVIIPPGTDPVRFSPPPQEPPGPPTLLTVGRLVPRKGVDTVLQALPLLLSEFPRLRYLIVGDGPDRPRLEALARDLGIASAVEFSGRVPDEALPQVYQRTHLFVMPVREEQEGISIEGFGIAYLEASASGLPVIAGRSGGAAEAVRDGVTGIVVPPDDLGALADALLRLLHDPELRRRMGQAGRRWVEEEMNWDRAAHQMQAVLEATW